MYLFRSNRLRSLRLLQRALRHRRRRRRDCGCRNMHLTMICDSSLHKSAVPRLPQSHSHRSATAYCRRRRCAVRRVWRANLSAMRTKFTCARSAHEPAKSRKSLVYTYTDVLNCILGHTHTLADLFSGFCAVCRCRRCLRRNPWHFRRLMLMVIGRRCVLCDCKMPVDRRLQNGTVNVNAVEIRIVVKVVKFAAA